MKFEIKMSGVKVSDYSIEPLFNSQVISLSEILEKELSERTMNYILHNFDFHKEEQNWFVIMSSDTILKLSILENYPNYEKELINITGENWLEHYIRFNH